MYKLELRDFILSHDNWEELLTADPYNLKISRDGDYIMFKYNQIASDFNIPLVREARGIILDEKNWDCACHPFNKFGNYGESYCPNIDWNTASVQEKIDGSLIKFWYYYGWHISTNGTIDAFKAELNNVKYQNFGQLVIDAIHKIFPDEHQFFKLLDPNCTYMFELVSPYNRVVIPYEETKLYFLGMRDMEDGDEWNPEDSDVSYFFQVPKHYNLHSLEDVQKAASKLPWDREGYVVCDGEFNRVKIKSPAYVAAHYTVANGIITKKKLLKVILAHEEEEFLTYCPEYKEAIDEVKEDMRELQRWGEEALRKISELPGYWRNYPRKEIFERVQDWPYIEFKYVMANYKEYVSWKDFTKNWSENKWIEILGY